MKSKLILLAASLLFLYAAAISADYDKNAPENFFDIIDGMGK